MNEQRNCIRGLLAGYRSQVTARSIRDRSTPLSSELCRCYELIVDPAVRNLSEIYYQSVTLGLIRWSQGPQKVRTCGDLDDEISLEVLKVLNEQIAADMTDGGCQPAALDMLDMHAFQIFWAYWLGAHITEYVKQLVEEFHFWELFDDLNQLPEEFRERYRTMQLEHYLEPLKKILRKDKLQMSIWLRDFFMEEKFLTVYRNQIIHCLNKWEKSLKQ